MRGGRVGGGGGGGGGSHDVRREEEEERGLLFVAVTRGYVCLGNGRSFIERGERSSGPGAWA